MRLFSKLVFICNICFVLSVLLRFTEMAKRAKGNFDSAIPIQPLQSTLIILGYGAIFLNIIFLFVALLLIAGKKIQIIPRWLVLVNFILLPLQVWYFFFSNF